MIRLTLSITILATLAPAQAVSSKNFLISSVELASGGSCASTNFRNVVAVGSGVVPGAMASTKSKIPGGFVATLDVVTTNQPWITHVTPAQIATNGNTDLRIHGINLGLGTAPTITMDGKSATLVSRRPDQIVAKQPALAQLGYPAVAVANSLGTAGLRKSVGVLPLIEADPAPAPNQRFDIVFRGTKGDTVIWAAGALSSPSIPLPPLLHGLGLHPGAMALLPGFGIASTDGVFRFAVPPTNYSGGIYLQAVFSSSNPGYAPGSFSNVLKL